MRWALAILLLCGWTVNIRAAGAIPFRTGILPILTKAGCNSGACHGAATGQGGFKLSLLGYDPEEDYDRITRELGARRVDLAHPDESLILCKPSGRIEHEGGRKLRRDSEGYAKVREWIANGAPFGPRELSVVAISVEPSNMLITRTNENRTLRVKASLSDGTTQDVTGLALYTSNDDAIAEVSKTGEIKTVGRGLTSIMVRYSGQVAAARIAVPFGRTAVVGKSLSGGNFIDDQIGRELARLGLPVSAPSSDAEFLRRLYLDVTGSLPTEKQARDFLSAPSSDAKRLRLIDELLRSDAFVDYWTFELADLLLLNGTNSSSRAYQGWLRQQIATHAPLDQMMRTLLTSSGNLSDVGPANLMTLASDPRDLSEHVGRIFLGIQMACARCHAHPADRWTQSDYHQFAAFFARVRVEGGFVKVSKEGEVEHPKTGKAMIAKPPGAPLSSQDFGEDRRTVLADWITSKENPYFARSMANRFWKHLLGRGLVEPVDDMRPTNPATHPALLEALAVELIKSGYDTRHLIRTIVSSRTYQLSSATVRGNEHDDSLYSHAYLKRLSAPVFSDAVAQVSGVADRFDGCPEGTRAVQLISPAVPSAALDILGRCLRKRSCESDSQRDGGLAQALHLINGSTINDKLNGELITELARLSNAEVINRLYFRAFVRNPTKAELREWQTQLAAATNRVEIIQDLMWTLLNSREFSINH